MGELERKGLGVHELMGRQLPGDLTLDEARAIIKSTDVWKFLLTTAANPERVELHFGWHAEEGDEIVPDFHTLDYWKEGPDPFLSINDGSGGLQVGVKPVLEDA